MPAHTPSGGLRERIRLLVGKPGSDADLARSLVQARRVTSKLPPTVSLIRGEYVHTDGRVYLDLEGVRDEVQAAVDEAARSRASAVLPVVLEGVPTDIPDECVNCGNIADVPHVVCPACKFREIAPCPNCGRNVPRTVYSEIASGLYGCPSCGHRVRLKYAEPLWDAEGYYREPLIEVEKA